MATHILIELDHEPFEVTRESIENLPDWVGEGQPNVGIRHWHYWLSEDDYITGPFGHYLISYRGKIEVWPPEDVAKYLKQNPYEACAEVAEKPFLPCDTGGDLAIDAYTGETIAQAIRQLEQKEIGR